MGAWCNDCGTCMTEGCYDSCGPAVAALFLVFLIVLAFVAAVMACAAAYACFYGAQRGVTSGDVMKRGVGLAALCAAGIALLGAQFLNWQESQSKYTPPCSKSWHSLALSWSSEDLNDVYFASCPGPLASLNAMRALMGLALVATAASLLLTIALKSLRPAAVAAALASILTAAAILIHDVNLLGDTDFCGSGKSLSQLGYEAQAGYQAAWFAFALIVIGGLIQPGVLHALNNKAAFTVVRRETPLPEELAPVVVEGTVTHGDDTVPDAAAKDAEEHQV